MSLGKFDGIDSANIGKLASLPSANIGKVGGSDLSSGVVGSYYLFPNADGPRSGWQFKGTNYTRFPSGGQPAYWYQALAMGTQETPDTHIPTWNAVGALYIHAYTREQIDYCMFGLTDLPENISNITKVTINLFAAAEIGGYSELGVGWYIGTTQYASQWNLTPGPVTADAWCRNEAVVDPSTGVAWTREGLNSAQLELYVVGQYSRIPAVSAIYIKVDCTIG